MRRILLRTLETLGDGVGISLIVVIVVAIVLLALRRRFRPPITGIIVVGVFVYAIWWRVEPVLAIGLLLLLLPMIVDVGDNLTARTLLALPGAALIGFGTTPGPVLLDASVTATIAIGGALAADSADAHEEVGIGTLFLILATVGGWLDIPDVDRILVLLGAALPVGLLVWPVPLARAGASAHVWVGALIWTAVDGGAIRLSSVIGTSTALGLLLVEPYVRRSLRWDEGVFLRTFGRNPRSSVIAPAALQAGLVLLASRVAGLLRNTELSLLIALVLLASAFTGLRIMAIRLDRVYAEDYTV